MVDKALRRKSTTVVFLVVAAMWVSMAAPGHAGPPQGSPAHENRPLHASCNSVLQGQGKLPHGAEITSREIREATATLPRVCKIKGRIVTSPASTINWAVELPEYHAWNGKTLTVGGGGFDGFIPTESPFAHARLGPSADPFVKMSSDSGHQTRDFYPWGMYDDAVINHGYRANHLTLEVGTSIATEFYGRAPERRYMFGHSNGGRSGLLSAQHYPDDYDGIIALEPAISQQAHQAFLPETLVHIFSDRDNWMSPAEVQLFAEAEIAACDGLDGIEDGIISNIEACDYTGEDLLCQGDESEGCLTEGQIETIRMIYSDISGFQLPDGLTPGYPRFGRGGAATGDWTSYMFGTSFEARTPFNYRVTSDAARVVTGDPNANIMNYDPADYQDQFIQLSEKLDPTDHDLSQFAENGGKLLIWYGSGDACVSVYRTADYFGSLNETMGEDAVRDFARFVTSPGLGHNLGGPGAGWFDFLAVMDDWVENETPPDDLVGSRFPGGFFDYYSEPVIQRPVCEWPRYAHYTGGDPTKADSFQCVQPQG